MSVWDRLKGWLTHTPSVRQQQIDREIALALQELEARDARIREAKLRDGLDAIMSRGK